MFIYTFKLIIDPQIKFEEYDKYDLCGEFFYDYKTSMGIFQWLEYLNFSYLLFIIGLCGMVFNYKNLLRTMLCIELMYLGIVTSILIIAHYTHDIIGQIYALTILILAASESAVGLGMLIVLFRYGKTISFDYYQELRG